MTARWLRFLNRVRFSSSAADWRRLRAVGVAPAHRGRAAARFCWTALPVVSALALMLQSTAYAGSLTSVSPTAASPKVSLNVTGTGFNTTAANNEVTFIPASGSTVTVTASAVVTINATTGTRRLTVEVPDGLSTGTTGLRVRNKPSGEVSAGLTFELIQITLPSLTSASPGTSGVIVPVQGSANTRFAAGAVKLSFGAGLSVVGLTVDSPNHLTATLNVASNAALGARSVALSGSHYAVAVDAFTIAAPNAQPAARSGGPYSGVVGQAVAFDGSASNDPDGDSLTYEWSFGDGTPVATSAAPTHTYAAAGTYTASLIVRDGKGGANTSTVPVTIVRANTPPTAHAGGPYSGTAGQPLSFNGDASTDGDGDALMYAWTFGDGANGTGPAATHTYGSAGMFSAALTVSDGHGGSQTESFTVQIVAPPLGRGVITGRVVDDATGLPLANATAQLLDGSDGSGAPAAVLPVSSDALGRYRISAAPGAARIRVAHDGYTSADLSVQAIDGKRIDPDDARLTPLGSPSAVSSVAGGTARSAGGVRLALPGGALAQDVAVRLTDLTGQGSIRRLPLGWSPIEAVDVDAGGAAFASSATLTVPAPGAPIDATLARWDATAGAWIASGQASRSGDAFEAEIARSGQYVFAAADPAPNNPPIPPAGTALSGVAPRAPPTIQLTLNPAPRVLFAQSGAKSRVTATASPSQPLPSGTPLDVTLAEQFTFASGSVLTPLPSRRRLGLYHASDAAGALSAIFTVAPSRPLVPFTLRQGIVNLAGRVPLSPAAAYGAVIGAAGGEFLAAGGERVTIPSGASGEDLPVTLSSIAADDVPVALPAGASLVEALWLDLHGAPLSRDLGLSIAAPTGVSPGALVAVAQIVDVGNATRLVLVATASVQNGRLVSTTDPLGTGAVQLPGIRGEGRFVVVRLDSSYGFVAGTVTAGGSPVSGALADISDTSLAALSDAAGKYVLLAPAGDAVLRVNNPATGDSSTTAVTVDGSLGVSARTVAIGAVPPLVIAVSPASAAQAVALGSAVTVTFSKAIDPASVVAGAIVLQAGSAPVAGTIAFAAGNAALTFRPASLLLSQTQYTLTIAATVRDAAGHSMAAPFTSMFTTIDVTPPSAPAPGTVVASIPDGSNRTTISGSTGTADPGGVVIVRNLRTNALTTLTPDANGSFTGFVDALRSDRLEITIKDAAGNATTLPVAPFRGADGSVVVGAAGGHVEGGRWGGVDIPAGALPDGTVVRIAPVPQLDLPIPAPAGYSLLAGVLLDLGGARALSELKLSVAAPTTAMTSDQVLVGRAVPFGSQTAWTVDERAHLVDGRYVTASPPFVGVEQGGTYAFLLPPGACTSYVSLRYHIVTPVFLVLAGLPFVVPTTDHDRATIPAQCGAQLTISVFDPDTQATLRQVSLSAPAARDDISFPPDVLTDDETLPTVLSVVNPIDQALTRLEVRFTKSIDTATTENFVVQDSAGERVNGTFEFRDSNSTVVFEPAYPFRQGEQYTLIVAGLKDEAGHPVDAPPMTFTAFGPRSISAVRQNADLSSALQKCGTSGCGWSARDAAVIGNTLFIANGVRTADERYTLPGEPRRLLAVDITDPFHPSLIGWSATGTNPRVLAAVSGAAFTASNGDHFAGNLLLVAGGGRVAGGELNTRLEIWDATACGRRPILPGMNCLASAQKGFRLLSTPAQVPALPGVPTDSGVPQQIAVLHQHGGATNADDVVLAYVVVSPIGLELVNVAQAFNLPVPDQSALGPDGVSPGDFTDISVLKNRVVAVGVNPVSAQPRVDVLNAQMALVRELPPPTPEGLAGFAGAARVGTVESLAFDIDNDGRLGIDEQNDTDPTKGVDELFDVALVASGPLTDGCVTVMPCGELYVLDLSGTTDLAHPGGVRVLARIPVPGAPFSIAIDAADRLAYVELRGAGIATIDLGFLLPILRGAPGSSGLVDANRDGRDDRIVAVMPIAGGQQDIAIARIKIDANRGLAIVNGSTTGVEIVQVANKANELALDFRQELAVSPNDLKKERQTLLNLITGAVAALRAGLPAGAEISVLEQGSGSCFWRREFPSDPVSTCPAFQPGTSDHDYEVFVNQQYVAQAQEILNAFIDSKPAGLNQLGDLSLFAMPREPFAQAELLNGTPLYGAGVSDATGDLGMGRQSLLLLWLLEGSYVENQQGTLPDLDEIFAHLRQKKEGGTAPAVISGEPSGIPRLEGFEWSMLQAFNLYKTGALLRVRGACEEEKGVRPLYPNRSGLGLGNDPAKNFNGADFLSGGCEDELHSVAKAAIRTVFARLVADDNANTLALQVDPAGADDLSAYHRNACFQGPFTTATATYPEVPCTGFEHYIASLALRAVRHGWVFQDSDLPQIYEFYCTKVGKCPLPGIQSDADADRFIRGAVDFLRKAQLSTLDIYKRTVRDDTKPIGDIPLLTAGPGGGAGIAAICDGLFTRHSDLVLPFLGPNESLPSEITAASPRNVLRLCNYIIVWLKTNGDMNPDPDDAHEVVNENELARHVQLETDTTNALKHRLGVRNYVDWKLQVRALNLGSRPEAINLSLYEGKGTDTDDYTPLKEIPVSLAPGEAKILAKEAAPDQPDPDKKQALYPLLFNLSRPELAASQPRALTFFLDPERTVPEADKKDNQASFFYYVLDTSNGGIPPASSDPVPPIDNVDPDPIALALPRLAFNLTVRGRTGGGFVGDKVISVGLDEDVTLKYELRNLGTVKLTDVQVIRDRNTVVTIPELAPAGQPGDHALLSDPTVFTPTEARTYLLHAHALGFDPKGNAVGPLDDVVSVTGSEDLSLAKARLFDASPLADLNHPFSRFLANTDDAGHAVPLVGAVTDGDAAGGGARIRVEIDRLSPDVPATVTLKDPDIPDATDGLGWLESGDQLALQSATVTPDITGRAVLYYRPPSVFVRDAHRAQDITRLERAVKLSIVQPGVGGGVKRVLLRRPPVFLVHGLFSNTDTWNELQPLVPEGGLVALPTKGYDGRFDVIAVGSPETSGSIADEAKGVKYQIKLALALTFPGYAIGRVDVIAHSMGSLIVRQIAKEFTESTAAWGGVLKLPFRKLIAMDTPFAGTPLADKIVDIRDKALVSPELDKPESAKDLLGIGDEGAPEVSAEVAVKAKLETCGLMVQSIGLTPKFFLHGAIDDLVAGSAAVLALANAGIPVPSHHISGTMVPPELGISLAMEALWGTLGYFCGLTPDVETGNATVLFNVGVQAATLLIPANVRALKPPTSVDLASASVSVEWAGASDQLKSVLSRVDSVAKVAKKTPGQPTPVFSFENDRAVQGGGQLGGLPVGSRATSSIDGTMDHNTILKTPGITVSACGDLSSEPTGLHDLNGDGTPDITCRLIYLLEAAPDGPLFFRSIQP